MDLFDVLRDPQENLLPQDGVVNYHGRIFDLATADDLFDRLMDGIPWRSDEAVIYGKRIFTKRKVAWYGDREFSYTYSKTTKTALPWTAELTTLKANVERETGEAYNSCLLNLYHTGDEGMAWHSDAEKDLKKDGAIASVSLGAERRFLFKHIQTEEVIETLLEHGSLLVMKGKTQSHWRHRLPPSRKVQTPRINLTFRQIRAGE
ncbi:MAG: alpha-ketoglutarate-dependent dioxygenase AlkB [Pseudomonadota bacterium]